MRTGSALCMIVVLALAATVQADLQVVVETTGTPAAGLTQYTVYLVSDSDDWATSFDGRFDGPMNQVWVGPIATPDMQYIGLLGADGEEDTHLLFQPAEMAVSKPPNEDGPGIGSYLASVDPNPPNDIITMAFGIKGAYQLANLPFAQIVVPDGEAVVMTGNFGRLNRTHGLVLGHGIAIPEPATLGLLALGTVGLILRRRRR